MKLHAAIADRDDRERRFTAALHGVEIGDHGRVAGKRMSHIQRMKARRGGH